MVVELLCPGDETYDKLAFYAAVEVQDVLVVDPESCHVELFALAGGRLDAVLPGVTGRVTATVLGVTLASVDGPALRLAWNGGEADITGRT